MCLSLKDGTHPAQSVLETGCGIGAGRRLEGKCFTRPCPGRRRVPDEGLEQVHDLLLLAAGKMGCGLKHLLSCGLWRDEGRLGFGSLGTEQIPDRH